jgi:hypothetical protein
LQQPSQQVDEQGEEEDIELSDFKVTNGEKEDIFIGKANDVLHEVCELRDDTKKWFNLWDKDYKSNIGVDEANDPDEESNNSENFDSLDSEEGSEGEGSCRRPRRRYPEWRKKRDLSETVALEVGLRFANPTEFKEALQVFAVQNSFNYKYLHNEKKRVSAYCKKQCGWKIHGSWSNCKKYFQIKTFESKHNCGSHYNNKKANIRWPAHRYVDIFRDQRDFKAKALKEMIQRDYNVELSLLSCHRVKTMANQLLDGMC